MNEQRNLGRLAVVRETVYRVGYPTRTARVLLLASVVLFALSPSWLGIGGIGMVLLATATTSPTFNVGNGCWLAIAGVGVAVLWPSSPGSVSIVALGSAAWLFGCLECRLTMVPDPDFAGQRHSGENVSVLGVVVLLLGASYISWRLLKTAA